MRYAIRGLNASTWDVFANQLNNGILGGCWCIGYHPACGQKGISHRAVEEDRVHRRQVGKHAWILTKSVGPESVSNHRSGQR
jgi:hypothetical protein